MQGSRFSEFEILHTYTSYYPTISGDLLGFGCRGHGQLLVWEWKSESYVLKQQGHSYDMTCVSYSPDSLSIATGGWAVPVTSLSSYNSCYFYFIFFSCTSCCTVLYSGLLDIPHVTHDENLFVYLKVSKDPLSSALSHQYQCNFSI